MLTYRVGAAGALSGARAMTAHLMEPTLSPEAAALAAYYACTPGAVGSPPEAFTATQPRVREDLDPALGRLLGLDPRVPPDADGIAHSSPVAAPTVPRSRGRLCSRRRSRSRRRRASPRTGCRPPRRLSACSPADMPRPARLCLGSGSSTCGQGATPVRSDRRGPPGEVLAALSPRSPSRCAPPCASPPTAMP